MPPVGFEPTISADERSKTHASDRTATGTGNYITMHGAKTKKMFFEELNYVIFILMFRFYVGGILRSISVSEAFRDLRGISCNFRNVT